MKKTVLVLIMITLFVMFTGCNENATTPTTPDADTPTTVIIKIINSSGTNWALDVTNDREEDWIDGSHYLNSKDFTLEAGGESRGTQFTPSKWVDFQEPTPGSFEGKILLLAAEVLAEDIDSSSHKINYIQELQISGSYGDTLIIQWTGSGFQLM